MNPRPRVLLIGPTPPPLHGPAIFTRMVLDSPVVREWVDVIHLDISDRRDLGNIGRLDLRNVRLALEHLARAVSLCVRHRPDVVHVQPSQNALAFLRDAGFILAGWLTGARVVTHLHGEAFGHFRAEAHPGVRLLIDAVHTRVSEAWVLGSDLRDRYAGLVSPDRIRVMPNGIPEAVRRGVEEAGEEAGARGAGGEAGALRVLHLGQLARSKGTDVVIRAAAEARSRGVHLTLTLAGGWGSPEEERVLGSLVDDVGGPWLERPGVVDGRVKSDLLARADVLALASRFPPGEGQPLAILEALAAGVCVVATPRGAVPETLGRGQAGVLVDVDRGGSFADALETLARDPEGRRALVAAGRRRFEEHYTEAACVGRLVDGFRAAAARQPR